MIANPEKAALISELHELRGENTCQKVRRLLALVISETRLANDNASPEQVLKNQGAIAVLSTILEEIERGLPL